jgi:hypothetical protein
LPAVVVGVSEVAQVNAEVSYRPVRPIGESMGPPSLKVPVDTDGLAIGNHRLPELLSLG